MFNDEKQDNTRMIRNAVPVIWMPSWTLSMIRWTVQNQQSESPGKINRQWLWSVNWWSWHTKKSCIPSRSLMREQTGSVIQKRICLRFYTMPRSKWIWILTTKCNMTCMDRLTMQNNSVSLVFFSNGH